MAYKYDVFLSYVTESPFGKWVHDHLLPFFEPYLKNALNQEVNLFVDRYEIYSGDAWPERIKNALAHSKCMVAIWSPAYFNSTWCKLECNVMLQREKQLGYRTINNPTGLVIPVNVFDGEHFPPYTRKIQCLDCRDFFRASPGFRNSPRYVDFEDLIIHWVYDVAKSINNAPPWSKEYEIWLDDPVDYFNQTSDPIFMPPTLE
jgi:hypothetical protein